MLPVLRMYHKAGRESPMQNAEPDVIPAWTVFFALLTVAVILIIILLLRRECEKVRFTEDEKQDIKRDSTNFAVKMQKDFRNILKRIRADTARYLLSFLRWLKGADYERNISNCIITVCPAWKLFCAGRGIFRKTGTDDHCRTRRGYMAEKCFDDL